MDTRMAQARKVVRMDIERFPLRNKNRVEIPQGPIDLIDLVTGFSNEVLGCLIIMKIGV
ncbi:MAG: hypothetical protein KKB30_00770 [Proteobacteria bacterium]|nr:hypothetical protein [Pseudomonadota bacterium]MBU1715344.1 hypothetical protein [Pseudomonadota bacterium]